MCAGERRQALRDRTARRRCRRAPRRTGRRARRRRGHLDARAHAQRRERDGLQRHRLAARRSARRSRARGSSSPSRDVVRHARGVGSRQRMPQLRARQMMPCVADLGRVARISLREHRAREGDGRCQLRALSSPGRRSRGAAAADRAARAARSTRRDLALHVELGRACAGCSSSTSACGLDEQRGSRSPRRRARCRGSGRGCRRAHGQHVAVVAHGEVARPRVARASSGSRRMRASRSVDRAARLRLSRARRRAQVTPRREPRRTARAQRVDARARARRARASTRRRASASRGAASARAARKRCASRAARRACADRSTQLLARERSAAHRARERVARDLARRRRAAARRPQRASRAPPAVSSAALARRPQRSARSRRERRLQAAARAPRRPRGVRAAAASRACECRGQSRPFERFLRDTEVQAILAGASASARASLIACNLHCDRNGKGRCRAIRAPHEAVLESTRSTRPAGARSEIVAAIHREDQARLGRGRPRCCRAIGRAADVLVVALSGGGALVQRRRGHERTHRARSTPPEIPPTFGLPTDRVQAIVAGGERGAASARSRARRTIPSRAALGAARARARARATRSSRSRPAGTPRSRSAASTRAHAVGARTIGITCDPGSPLAEAAEIAIVPLGGSRGDRGLARRMKGGPRAEDGAARCSRPP